MGLHTNRSLGYTGRRPDLDDVNSLELIDDDGDLAFRFEFEKSSRQTRDGESQQITRSGSVSGGTFTITFDGQTTSAIAWNASASDVRAALAALSNIGALDVFCYGGPLPNEPIEILFTGSMAEAEQDPITINSGSLTGGGSFVPSSETRTVATQTTTYG